jgi:hypothetical protein
MHTKNHLSLDVYFISMRKQITLILPLVAAMISTLVFATVESASAQNASMNGNACMSCGERTNKLLVQLRKTLRSTISDIKFYKS